MIRTDAACRISDSGDTECVAERLPQEETAVPNSGRPSADSSIHTSKFQAALVGNGSVAGPDSSGWTGVGSLSVDGLSGRAVS